jgi:hypothetical protein
MSYKDCFTQTDLEQAVANGDIPVLKAGEAWFEVKPGVTVIADAGSYVTAWENSTVTARGNSTVTAWGNSTVTAWENSTVTARGNSTVTARENSTVTARGNSTVTATPYVAIHKLSERCKLSGGVIITPPKLYSVDNWLEFFGIEKDADGNVTLFKAVNDQYESARNQSYAPGEAPVCVDFQRTNECGNGFHLCAAPIISQGYFEAATKYVACTVDPTDIQTITDSSGQSDKVKVAKILKCVEVDVHGKALFNEEEENRLRAEATELRRKADAIESSLKSHS